MMNTNFKFSQRDRRYYGGMTVPLTLIQYIDPDTDQSYRLSERELTISQVTKGVLKSILKQLIKRREKRVDELQRQSARLLAERDVYLKALTEVST